MSEQKFLRDGKWLNREQIIAYNKRIKGEIVPAPEPVPTPEPVFIPDVPYEEMEWGELRMTAKKLGLKLSRRRNYFFACAC